MRVQIRALEQDVRNVQNGKALLRTALSGAEDIVKELRTLKELALNSCNDHNTDADRSILQKEFDARKAHIDHIATDTNFNGIRLLDGRWKRKIRGKGIEEGERLVSQTTSRNVVKTPGETTTENLTDTKTLPAVTKSKIISQTTTNSATEVIPSVTVSDPITNTSTTSKTYTKTSTETLSSDRVLNEQTETTDGNQRTVVTNETVTSKKVTSTSDVEAQSTTTTTAKTITNVAVEKVGGTDSDDLIIIQNGTTEITENGIYRFAPDYTGTLNISAKKVQLQGPSNGATLNDVYIKDTGVEHLYVKNLNINNSQDISTIAFDSATNNILHVFGNNTFAAVSGVYGHSAIINVGGGLDIVGNGYLNINDYGGCDGAKIGSDENGSCGDISIGQNVNINIVRYFDGGNGASIGSGVTGICGNICIGSNANVSISVAEGIGCAIGGGSNFLYLKDCGDIIIYSKANVNVHAQEGAGIGSGAYVSKCGNITIYSDAKVNASSNRGAGIGTGSQPGTNYKIKNEVGNITIYSYSSGDVVATSNEGQNIGFGRYPNTSMKLGAINLLDEYKYVEGGVLDLNEISLGSSWNVTTTVTEETTTEETVNEVLATTNEYFEETENIITTSVYEHYRKVDPDKPGKPLVIHTGTKANINKPIHIEDMRLDALGVKNTKISQRDKAQESLEVIDTAINYALDQATTLGAHYNGLEFAESNLTSVRENTVSSESVICDADIAKEITEFAKNNILMQTSQAMLSQVNKDASSVLGLLQ